MTATKTQNGYKADLKVSLQRVQTDGKEIKE